MSTFVYILYRILEKEESHHKTIIKNSKQITAFFYPALVALLIQLSKSTHNFKLIDLKLITVI